MANLHFVYGVMAASKSAQLCMQAHQYRQTGCKYEVIKPLTDNRDAVDYVVSRIGLKEKCIALNNLQKFTPKPDTQFVLIDEVQFFSAADIDKLVEIVDYNPNITVLCYGLKTDIHGHLWPASQRLLEVDAATYEIKTVCQNPGSGCTNRASYNARFKNGLLDINGPIIEIGSAQYISLCRKCYNLYKRIAIEQNKGK